MAPMSKVLVPRYLRGKCSPREQEPSEAAVEYEYCTTVPGQRAVARTDRMERINSTFYHSKLHFRFINKCRYDELLLVLMYKISMLQILGEATKISHTVK